MNALARLRPEPQPLDAEWSTATLQRILAGSEPGAARRTKARRRVLASTTAAVAAGVALVIGGSSVGTSGAFAVEQTGNGDLIVIIHRLTDPAGLEKALRDHGLNVHVTYLRTQTPSDLDDGSDPSPCVATDQIAGVSIQPEEGDWTITLERSYLATHRGAELSITAAGGTTADDWAGMRLDWSDGLC